jgi:hypothetical protein
METLLVLLAAFVGSLCGSIVFNMLRKVEAQAKPDSPMKAILKPVAGQDTPKEPIDRNTNAWLYHKPRS